MKTPNVTTQTQAPWQESKSPWGWDTVTPLSWDPRSEGKSCHEGNKDVKFLEDTPPKKAKTINFNFGKKVSLRASPASQNFINISNKSYDVWNKLSLRSNFYWTQRIIGNNFFGGWCNFVPVVGVVWWINLCCPVLLPKCDRTGIMPKLALAQNHLLRTSSSFLKLLLIKSKKQTTLTKHPEI